MSRASWGRSSLNSCRKLSKRSCCCRLLIRLRAGEAIAVDCWSTARDVMEQLSTWRAGIGSAIGAKLTKASYLGQQLDLLVYDWGCSFDLIDFSLAEVVVPALDAIGKSNWGRVFA